MADYPEHTKLSKVQDQSQAVHDFMEYVENKYGAFLAHYREGEHYPRSLRLSLGKSQDDLLEEFFGIDRTKLEAEKVRMLEEQRALNRRVERLEANPCVCQPHLLSEGVPHIDCPVHGPQGSNPVHVETTHRMEYLEEQERIRKDADIGRMGGGG